MEITREIHINAPKDKVWAIISDINNWSQSTTAINQSSGTLALGAELSITMRGHEAGPDGIYNDGPSYKPKITELNDGTSFRWRAKMGASIIFTNDKFLMLEEIEGGTKLTHTEYFSGMMLPLMKGMMQKGVPALLDEINEGFKAAAEAL